MPHSIASERAPEASAAAHCVIVLHIPKTAGTSLLTIVRRQYAPRETWAFEGPDWARQLADFEVSPPAHVDRIRCLMGHVSFGVHRVLNQPATYLTMLRDPVDWTLSLYYALLTKPQSHPGLRVVAEQGMSLDAFIDYLSDAGRCNPQTRFIGGFVSKGQIVLPQPPLPAGALETARSNLASMFSAVGIVEFFDASILFMKRTFGWRNIYYVRQNVTAMRPREAELTAAQRDRILRCHALDVALYESARHSFLERLEQMEPAFSRELERYQRINSIYGRARSWYWRARGLAGRVKRRILGARADYR